MPDTDPQPVDIDDTLFGHMRRLDAAVSNLLDALWDTLGNWIIGGRMPLVIMRRCAECHDMQPSDAYPSVMVGKKPDGKPKRVFSAYCHQCLSKNPELHTAFAVQAADQKK